MDEDIPPVATTDGWGFFSFRGGSLNDYLGWKRGPWLLHWQG